MEKPPVSMEIPDTLEFKPSALDPTKTGVWTKCSIPKGTRFGPLEGQTVAEIDGGMDTNYVWEIVDEDSDDVLWYIDATVAEKSNWLRFIKCARFFEEQNMLSEQEGVEIYYTTIKDVEAGVELLTWFDKSALAMLQKKNAKRNKKTRSFEPNPPQPVKRRKKSLNSKKPERKQKKSSTDDFATFLDGQQSFEFNHGGHTTEELEKIKTGPNRYPPPKEGEYMFDLLPHHVAMQSNKKIYKCDICTGAYRHAFSLKRHYIRNHINYHYICEADRLNCCIKLEEVENSRRRMQAQYPTDSDKNNNMDGNNDDQTKATEESNNKPESLNADEPEADKLAIKDEVSQSSQTISDVTKEKIGDDQGSKSCTDAPLVRGTKNEDEVKTAEERERVEMKLVIEKDSDEVKPTVEVERGEEKPTMEEESDGVISGVENMSDTSSSSFQEVHQQTSDTTNSLSKEDCVLPIPSQDTKDGTTCQMIKMKGAAKPTNQEMPGLFRCNLCNDLFDDVGSLKGHLDNHPSKVAAKTYNCEQCEMTFSQKQNLMRHVIVHTGAKPFECRFCKKHFPTITNRKRHEMIHLGKKFCCSVCDSSFSQSGDLKKHIRRVHPESFHDCAFCPKYFSDENNLISHLASHNETIETNDQLKNEREECTQVDLSKDREQSMKLAEQKAGFKFACTICKKRFHNYANMCRHRRLAHQRHLLGLGKSRSPTKIVEEEDEGESSSDNEAVFYANVAQKIAENLAFHIDGNIKSLHSLKKVSAESSKIDEETSKQSSVIYWDKYNISTNLVTKIKDCSDQPQSTAKSKKDSQWTKGEKWQEFKPIPEHYQLNGPKPKGLPISVPQFHKCNICKCVFHNKFLYDEHMKYKHQQLEFFPGKGPGILSPTPSVSLFDRTITKTPDYTTMPLTNSYKDMISDEPLDLSPKNRIKDLPKSSSPENLHFSAIELKASLSKKKQSNVINKYEVEYRPSSEPLNFLSKSGSNNSKHLHSWGSQSDHNSRDSMCRPQKYQCTVCLRLFPHVNYVTRHQREAHPHVECEFVEADTSNVIPLITRPSPVGLLKRDMSSPKRYFDLKDNRENHKPVRCTKCQAMFPSPAELHLHIVSCANQEDQPTQKGSVAPQRGKRTKVNIKKRRYSKKAPQAVKCQNNLPVKDFTRLSVNGVKRPNKTLLGMLKVRKRRRNFELLYNPDSHIRRREMTELVDMHKCKGCDAKFKTILLLERHIRKCSEKDKLKDVQVRQPLFVDGIYEKSRVPSKQHVCHYCHKQFVYEGSLRSHVFKVCRVRKHHIHKGGRLALNWEADLKQQARAEVEKMTNGNQKSHETFRSLAGRKRKKRKNHRWTLVKRRKDEMQEGEVEEGDLPDNIELDQMDDADDESEGSSTGKMDSASNSSDDNHFSQLTDVVNGNGPTCSENIIDGLHQADKAKKTVEQTQSQQEFVISKQQVVAKLQSAIINRQKTNGTKRDLFKPNLYCKNRPAEVKSELSSSLRSLDTPIQNGQETPVGARSRLSFTRRRKHRALSQEILHAELLDISDDDLPLKPKRGRGRVCRGGTRKTSRDSCSSTSSEVVDTNSLNNPFPDNTVNGMSVDDTNCHEDVDHGPSDLQECKKAISARGRRGRGRGRGRKRKV